MAACKPKCIVVHFCMTTEVTEFLESTFNGAGPSNALSVAIDVQITLLIGDIDFSVNDSKQAINDTFLVFP